MKRQSDQEFFQLEWQPRVSPRPPDPPTLAEAYRWWITIKEEVFSLPSSTQSWGQHGTFPDLTRLAAFISVLTYSTLCFPKRVQPTTIGKETFISCGISHWNWALFLCTLAHRTSFYAPLHTRTHFTNLCELWAWPPVCPKMSDACLYCCVVLAKRERLPGTTVAHRSTLSSSSLLSLNSKPDGPYVHNVHGSLL